MEINTCSNLHSLTHTERETHALTDGLKVENEWCLETKHSFAHSILQRQVPSQNFQSDFAGEWANECVYLMRTIATD